MVCGNDSILGRPWEPIIKIYRKQFSNKCFNSLYDYARDFVRYLGNRSLFPSDIQESFFYRKLVELFQDMILDEMKSSIEDSEEDKPIRTVIAKTISAIVSREHGAIKRVRYIRGMNTKTFEKFQTKYATILNKAIDTAFEDFTEAISKESRRKLREIGCYYYTKEICMGTDTSNVIVAGFGEKDIFPSMVAIEVETVIDDKLKYLELEKEEIGLDTNALIQPFGQLSVISTTFITGIDPRYARVSDNYLREMIDTYADHVIDALPDLYLPELDEIIRKLKVSGENLLDEYKKKMENCCKKNHVDPILNIVSHLPMKELAEMAEALVSLTSSKTRVSGDAETVGGPIDVALISKGDGFVWIKRKHYFKPELNYRFFQNYFRE